MKNGLNLVLNIIKVYFSFRAETVTPHGNGKTVPVTLLGFPRSKRVRSSNLGMGTRKSQMFVARKKK